MTEAPSPSYAQVSTTLPEAFLKVALSPVLFQM